MASRASPGRTAESAALRPRHVARAPFGPLAWAISLLLSGAIAVQSFVPLYVRGGRGGGTALTAWSVLFFTVGWTLGANLSSKILDRMAESTLVAVSFGIAIPGAATTGLLAAAGAPLWMIFAALTVLGGSVGSATNAALTLLRDVADDGELGRATAAHQFLRNQGITVGAALGGATILLVVSRRIGDTEQVRALLSGADAAASAPVAHAIAAGFTTAGLAGAAVITSGIVPLVVLRRHLAPARRRRRG